MKLRKTIKKYLENRKVPKTDVAMEIEDLELSVSNHTFYTYDYNIPIEEIRVTDCRVSYHPAIPFNDDSGKITDIYFRIELDWVEKIFNQTQWENKTTSWNLNVSEKELRDHGSTPIQIKSMVLSSFQLSIGNYFRNRISSNDNNPVIKKDDFLHELQNGFQKELQSDPMFMEVQRRDLEKDQKILQLENKYFDVQDEKSQMEKVLQNLIKRIDVLQEASTNQFEEVMKPIIEETDVLYENGSYFTCCIKFAQQQADSGRNSCNTCGRGLTNKLRFKMGFEPLPNLPV